jgi:hypothetical protein
MTRKISLVHAAAGQPIQFMVFGDAGEVPLYINVSPHYSLQLAAELVIAARRELVANGELK